MGTDLSQALGRQSLAIKSLREMIADTDLLLERVLNRLEASDDESRSEAERQPTSFRASR